MPETAIVLENNLFLGTHAICIVWTDLYFPVVVFSMKNLEKKKVENFEFFLKI
jgi:hypothetical protein